MEEKNSHSQLQLHDMTLCVACFNENRVSRLAHEQNVIESNKIMQSKREQRGRERDKEQERHTFDCSKYIDVTERV